jgi:hypothetical protein
MSVEFLNDGAEAVYKPGNGHTIVYRRFMDVYYHADTPAKVVQALNAARQARTRIRLYYGDTETGRDWLEEHDVVGKLVQSLGPLRVSLLIPTCRSDGGPALLDHCIVKIKETRSGRICYQHPKYHTGTFAIREVGPGEMCGNENLRDRGYTHAVMVNGQSHANFKSVAAAQRYVRKMTA